jgi:hypothetical protein
MLLHEISQILAATENISTYQEEQILIAIRNIFASQEAIEQQRIHEQLP